MGNQEENQQEQSKIQHPVQNKDSGKQTIKKEINLELPSDPNILSTSIKNLYVGLNKAAKNGAYDLQESAQLHNDLSMLSVLVNQLIKKND